jgi:hypothetical protein
VYPPVTCPSPAGDGMATAHGGSPRLLILMCSQVKRRDAGLMPAWKRYDSPIWQTLRKHNPAEKQARVAVLSARYGIIPAQTEIPYYDEAFTQETVQQALATVAVSTEVEEDLAEVKEVAMVGSEAYRNVMQAAVERIIARRSVAPALIPVAGSYLDLRRGMRLWLAQGGAL